jgi:hypothetical protein
MVRSNAAKLLPVELLLEIYELGNIVDRSIRIAVVADIVEAADS